MILTHKERISFELRALYSQNGFNFFRMPRFEEYDFYADKKEFLSSKSILTFTDADGRLMALRPDVTLSLIKHSAPGKYHYCENVYRVPDNETTFREVAQSGIEITGGIGANEMREVIMLAVKSLEKVSDGRRYILAIADASQVIENADGINTSKLIDCLSHKNIHGLKELHAPRKLIELAEHNGDIASSGLLSVKMSEILRGLEEYYEKMRVDYSVAENVKYYSGIVFKGYIEGVPEAVLSGGEYNIMSTEGAGFAVYLERICDD